MNTSEHTLRFHYLEWVLGHPRFGGMMMILIALSFTNNQIFSAVLFVLFSIEIAMRILLFRQKVKLNPYRSSMGHKIDLLLLVVDIIAVSSLLVTALHLGITSENLTAARFLRGIYLLRSLRMIRYFDLRSVMFSPTYGMMISLVILVSFFATGTILHGIIIIFVVELALRLIVLQNMGAENPREKSIEWTFWVIDLLATVFMLPFISGFRYSGALRMLRLFRLLRPWKVILSNLREVLQQGQFMQEINLILLFLAILSIGGGIMAHMIFPGFDFARGELLHPSADQNIFSSIWFTFRMLTDPASAVEFPDSLGFALFTIVSIIMGLFIFAFFIGIGENIVSGLMRRLRNEDLLVKDHMAILGWTTTSPYIITQLRILSERSFTSLKVVLLDIAEREPTELIHEKWVTYRQGDMDSSKDLKRINMAAAKQALMILPQGQQESDTLSHAFYNMLAVRRQNKSLKFSIAVPGMDYPRLTSHKHMLQVGWDNKDNYSAPTVLISEADFRATALCNILRYSDFDQVMQRLMIPELLDESAAHLVAWDAELKRNDENAWDMYTPDGEYHAEVATVQARMFKRGVVFIGFISDTWDTIPLYALHEKYQDVLKIRALLGISINDIDLYDAAIYSIRKPEMLSEMVVADLDEVGLKLEKPEDTITLLVMGWVGSLPLLLKRLIRFYHKIDLVILDALNEEEIRSQREYLARRLQEEPGLEDLINIKVKTWDFNDMEVLREHVAVSSRIILSRPCGWSGDAYPVIATALSHIVTIIKDEGVSPKVFPLLSKRDQAGLLQQELGEYDLPAEVHVTVPEEFYAAFVAHTSFNMYAAETAEDYQLKRAFRHTLRKLLSDAGENADMGLKVYKVTASLPEDAMQLFHNLQASGHIWVGYTMDIPYKEENKLSKKIVSLFPRQTSFSCQRQNMIVINPNGNPYTQQAWMKNRAHILEIITLGGDDDVEMF